MPLTIDEGYRHPFQRRIRPLVDASGLEPFEIWCARPEDIIIGKLITWQEGRSPKHENDVYEMLVFRYLGLDPALSADFDEQYITVQVQAISDDAAALWAAIQTAAGQEAGRG